MAARTGRAAGLRGVEEGDALVPLQHRRVDTDGSAERIRLQLREAKVADLRRRKLLKSLYVFLYCFFPQCKSSESFIFTNINFFFDFPVCVPSRGPVRR
jgi:hypothetical protein